MNVQTLGNTGAKTRIVANQIAEKLIAAEAAINAAVAAVASLTASMPMASQEAGVGIHVGHDALMHAMESCQQLVKARTNIIRTHSALRTAQSDVGLETVAISDLTNCPPNAERQDRHLSVVAA